jgi:hypothetical protein
VGPRRLPLGGRAAQGMQEGSLLDGIAVGVLGQQPCRPGAVLAGQRPPRPAPGAENVREPSRVVLIDTLPLRGQLSGNRTLYPPGCEDTRLRIR